MPVTAPHLQFIKILAHFAAQQEIVRLKLRVRIIIRIRDMMQIVAEFVEIQAVGAGVRIHAVNHNADTGLPRFVAQFTKFFRRTENRIYIFIVRRIIPVVGSSLGNRI